MRYSEQANFNSCPAKYDLIINQKLRKIEEGSKSNDKNYGQAIHAGLEEHYKGKEWPDIERRFKEVYPRSLDESKPEKSVESGIACLRAYREHWKGQDEQWEVIATEQEGQIEIAGELHALHVDLVAKHKQTGEIYIWDHKTTGNNINSYSFKKYELSGQMTRYVVWCIEKYGSCAGAVINLIAVGHRKKKYLDEPAGPWQKFERAIVNRTPQQIKFWRESDAEWMKLIDYCKKNGVWPKHLSDLCSYCEFYELCLSGGDSQIRELMYTNEPSVSLSEFKPVIEVSNGN